MDTVIRTYASPDRDMPQIKRICWQSAFLGEPLDSIFNDQEWFAEFMITPYLIFEPECTWVAEVDGTIVGYLNGSVKKFFRLLQVQFIATKMIGLYWRYMLGKYKDHPRSDEFAKFILTEAPFQIPKYPASTPHFHFNVDKDHRGMGIGSKLLAAFEETLREKGINSYYAEVISSKEGRSEEDFIRLGYSIFDKKPTTVFRRERGNLDVLCVVRNC